VDHFKVPKLAGICDDAFGETEADGEIFQIRGTGHHHRMCRTVMDNRDRGFLSDQTNAAIIPRRPGGSRQRKRGLGDQASPPGAGLQGARPDPGNGNAAPTAEVQVPRAIPAFQAICSTDSRQPSARGAIVSRGTMISPEDR
jgi:hypothetical protein